MSAASLQTAVPGAVPSWRALEYLSLARVLIASALILSITVLGAPLLGRAPVEKSPPELLLAATLAYFVAAAALAFPAFFLRRHFAVQVIAQLVVDIVLLTLLMTATGGLRGGIAILYLLPLAGAALMLSTVTAFFFCALAVLAVLGDTALRALRDGGADAQLFQAGLYGVVLFGVAAVLRLLSSRLAGQAELARSRGRDLEIQLEINRLVIAQMEQGVIVVDAQARVRANNRAARVLLGLAPGAQLTGRRLTDVPESRPLAEAFAYWLQAHRSSGVWSERAQRPADPGDDPNAHTMPDIQVRARFARPPSETSDEYVIFLEDRRAIEERAQQLKLASMGRLTASIAHEIRNPLAAISHAGQMLGEEANDPLHQRLAAIVRENTRRLNRLVDDVLRVARREAPLGDDIALAGFVGDWLAEFARDRNVPPDRVRLTVAGDVHANFERSHLRQVLFNLVDNALRYASEQPGAVELAIERAADDAGRARLWVFDDGAGVAPEARGALFEPFFTTHARGTGLGLYLAREFCVANRADLSYAAQRQLDGGSRYGFMLRFSRTAADRSEDTGFLDTIPAL